MKFLILTLFLPAFIQGQSRINGVIQDTKTNSPVIGAKISFTKNGVYEASKVTGRQGQYSVWLHPGNYTMQISHKEYSELILENLKTAPNKEISLNLKIDPITHLCGGATIWLYDPSLFWTKDFQANSLWQENIKRFPTKQVQKIIQSVAGISSTNF